ncbi:unnamed protein product [Knipowitschia caucasica]|uniref:Uncharacterized protein n=1 Tax=Knipowitschia caucasica TaxID=637954 RepID=A0AAV2ISS7_KNICA
MGGCAPDRAAFEEELVLTPTEFASIHTPEGAQVKLPGLTPGGEPRPTTGNRTCNSSASEGGPVLYSQGPCDDVIHPAWGRGFGGGRGFGWGISDLYP